MSCANKVTMSGDICWCKAAKRVQNCGGSRIAEISQVSIAFKGRNVFLGDKGDCVKCTHISTNG
jgi:hypothetical protein